jgi:hypothetical protein
MFLVGSGLLGNKDLVKRNCLTLCACLQHTVLSRDSKGFRVAEFGTALAIADRFLYAVIVPLATARARRIMVPRSQRRLHPPLRRLKGHAQPRHRSFDFDQISKLVFDTCLRNRSSGAHHLVSDFA